MLHSKQIKIAVWRCMTKTKHQLIIATKGGMVIKIDPDKLKVQKRGGRGVKLMGLNEGDEVVSVALRKDEED